MTARTVCDKQRAEEWLRADLAPIESFLSAIPEVCKTQGRFDACADFCFNLGINAFRGSTLLKRIQHKDPTDTIQREFRKWVYAAGRVLDGLVRRRKWEAEKWACSR